jgi:hypothetical protein
MSEYEEAERKRVCSYCKGNKNLGCNQIYDRETRIVCRKPTCSLKHELFVSERYRAYMVKGYNKLKKEFEEYKQNVKSSLEKINTENVIEPKTE